MALIKARKNGLQATGAGMTTAGSLERLVSRVLGILVSFDRKFSELTPVGKSTNHKEYG
jgi:hypothetical protein